MEILQIVDSKLPQKPNVEFGGQFEPPKVIKASFKSCSCALMCRLCPQNGGHFHDLLQKLPLSV